MRQIVNKKFLKSAVRGRTEEIERIAAGVVDLAATHGEIAECDFVDTFAAPFPVAVISWVLGVPRSDWEHHFRWTNEIIGKDDPEYRRPGESPDQTSMRARGELHRYFKHMIEQRRQDPQDDLVTVLVQSEIDGVPLTKAQLVSYCELLVEAGNQTTRDAIAGGMQAFCEYPEQWEKLRAQSELLPDAVEEILRWVTPISYFSRTATEDCELHGQKIHAGDKVALYWASANRDEEVFEHPFEFRDRPSAGPATGIRIWPPPLHGCPRGPRRASGDVRPLDRSDGMVRTVRPGGAPQFIRERGRQAPADPLPADIAGLPDGEGRNAAARNRAKLQGSANVG